MNQNKTIIEEIEFPEEGDLVMTFEFDYRDGSYDHRRSGRRCQDIKIAGGKKIPSYDLSKCKVPGLELTKRTTRMGRYETVTETLTIPAGIALPVTVYVSETDEYYPDYYNELNLPYEEREPTRDNKKVEVHVVKRKE